MSRSTRFRQLLGQPAYRTKLIFFLVLSVSVFLLAILLQSRFPFWSDVLLEFAVVFGAVGILQLTWEFLGGQPMELQIAEVKDEVRNIKSSMTLLSDLLDGNIGIERIWPDRGTWQHDPVDGLEVWHARVCQAKCVDMMSNTLWNYWMHEEGFRKRLFDRIAQGAHVRILIYDPDSDVLRLRARDERDVFFRLRDEGEVFFEMQQEIISTLRGVAEIWKDLPMSAKGNLEVCLTNQTLHPAQIIRADERMVVGIYLSGKSGTPSPTMQLRGSDSSYFRKYEEQFESLWGQPKPLNDERFSRILQDYGRLPTPLVED